MSNNKQAELIETLFHKGFLAEPNDVNMVVEIARNLQRELAAMTAQRDELVRHIEESNANAPNALTNALQDLANTVNKLYRMTAAKDRALDGLKHLQKGIVGTVPMTSREADDFVCDLIDELEKTRN